MSVYYDQEKHIFKLDTAHTSYLIGLTKEGYLGHITYGARLERADGFYLLRTGHDPEEPSYRDREKVSFMDTFPTEYSVGGVGDFRESCLNLRNESGNMGCELFYKSHEIFKGKPSLEGLPASFGTEDEVETLQIVCVDPILHVTVTLSYSVFEKEDILTRSVHIRNDGSEKLLLEKIYSACLDMDNEDFRMLTLRGAWGRERHIQQRELAYGKQSVSSAQGKSSHQEHPFMALVTPGTTQEQGQVYAMHFVYSGNFIAQAQLNQFSSVRMVMGISPEEFCWNLGSGESFQAPEVVMTYSDAGLGKMTRSFHDFYRQHLLRGPFCHQKRPILINNWEATYFDFNTDKLLSIAREAKRLGIEMLVMDDGWFGKRNSDDCSLGDWQVNEAKLPGGVKYLAEEVEKIGLKFGIWFEPEMVSRDSDLYRLHPDWAIQIPGRQAAMSRAQYVLDLSNPQAEEYAYESVARILRGAPISYVKWDMNRLLCDLGSAYLGRDAQQELSHRYVLAVYRMQERLLREFPNLLLENCSSGGARFDPGMLYYSPQIWCSDDTDGVERLQIQEGTALIYPLSCMGAHVSDCPNHALGRTTSFTARGHVALAGTFGYELDVTKLSQEDREQIPLQCALYHQYHDLIREGDYYRIASYGENHLYDCYMVVAKDKTEALLTYVQVLATVNMPSRRIRLRGLDPKGEYLIEETGLRYPGDLLMQAGLLIEPIQKDAVSLLYHLVLLPCNHKISYQ
jgi:alpha-galactosidase